MNEILGIQLGKIISPKKESPSSDQWIKSFVVGSVTILRRYISVVQIEGEAGLTNAKSLLRKAGIACRTVRFGSVVNPDLPGRVRASCSAIRLDFVRVVHVHDANDVE